MNTKPYKYSIWRDDDGCCNFKAAEGDNREDCIRWMRKHWNRHGPFMLMDNESGRLVSFVL